MSLAQWFWFWFPWSANQALITHADGSANTVVPGYMAAVANNQGDGQGWKLSLIPSDPSAKPIIQVMHDGDTYQNQGTLPPNTIYADRSIVDSVLPIGTVKTIP